MNKKQFLTSHIDIIQNKKVLDLACHTGESTQIIHNLGAKHIYAVDVRPELIQQAQQRLSVNNVEFFTGDITDNQLTSNLVENSTTITCFGVLYHLFNHFNFFSNIFKSNIEYVLFETEFGSESLKPEMQWTFQETDKVYYGWYKNFKVMPVGIPNLSWILQSADLFGFKCDWIKFYGEKNFKTRHQVTLEEYYAIAGTSWPSYQELISINPIPNFIEKEISQFLHITDHKRMIIRLYNTDIVKSTPLELETIYQWPNNC
jgi:SAM-dependent methyltransferase